MKTFLFSCILLLGAAAAQTTHEVEMIIAGGEAGTEFYFEPVGLYIEPGDTVRFLGVSPHHNVVAYHAQHGKSHRVPDGVGPFSSPIVPVTDSWEMTFDVAGTYDLWCGPHEPWGMAMRVVVGVPGGPAEEPITDVSPGGVFGTAATVLSDPALASSAIVLDGRVSWAALAPESKAQAVPADELVGRVMQSHGAGGSDEGADAGSP